MSLTLLPGIGVTMTAWSRDVALKKTEEGYSGHELARDEEKREVVLNL